MKKLIFIIVVFAASTVIVMSFFQPWAEINASVTGVSKELTKSASTALGETSFAGKFIRQLNDITSSIGNIGDIELKSTVRGNNIPVLANDQTSKVALSLVQVLFKNKGTENIGKKSYLVYLLPLSGILCAVLALFALKHKIYLLIMAAISGIISIGGLYNLYTMDVVSPVVKITIENGLWNTMYAFGCILLVAILWLASSDK